MKVPVLIVGGGPTGLVLATELGQKGVRCLLVEASDGTSAFPKANLTSARSMEHYRRLGFAREFRAMGLPEDFPQDITFWTRYSRHELTRMKVPSAREAARMATAERGHWMTPELPHRAQQMAFEVLLRQAAQRQKPVELRYGWRLADFRDTGTGIDSTLEDVATGESLQVHSDYLVGCDGPRSLVREKLGLRYEGEGSADRDFFGGKMLAMHFRCPAMYAITRRPPAWHYWTVNPERRALMVSLDGRERFVAHVQLPKGIAATEELARQWLNQAAGVEVPAEIIKVLEWTAGYTLVADRYRSGRAFIAGDAAHLFTPAAGLGYNTSIDDVANFAWKLAAAVQGWGGPKLLDTYESERRPVGVRNTRFARSTANNVGNIPMAAELEEESAAGEKARAELGRRVLDIVVKEFEIPGLILGVCYRGSPIVAGEAGAPPEDDMHVYRPSTYPGCRLPHLFLQGDRSTLDCVGRGFTLLSLGRHGNPVALERAAAEANVPLRTERLEDDAVRDVYGCDYLLVRPDQHVAWRGNALPADPAALIATVTGH